MKKIAIVGMLAVLLVACAESGTDQKCSLGTDFGQAELEEADGGQDGGSIEPIKACANTSECNDGNPCTVDSCQASACVYTAPIEPIGCDLGGGIYGTCVWGSCMARSCVNQENDTPCVDHAAPGICIDGVCHKECETNYGCDDGVLCTADYCANGGYCVSNDSCSTGMCDTSSGICVQP